jgi:hypothetical protein
MKFFPSRLARVESEYRVEVKLQDHKSSELLPASCAGIMVNISQGGACLVLFKLMLEGKHLFFSTLNNEHHHLVVLIENPVSPKETVIIPACSVWMDSCFHKGESAFKIGISFHERQKELFQNFKKLRKEEQA